MVVGREGDDPSEPAKYTGEVVTAGHSGCHEGERQRLAQHGGKKPKIRKDDGYITVPVPGLPSGLFSLAMTRALGHRMMAAYGVIPTPGELHILFYSLHSAFCTFGCIFILHFYSWQRREDVLWRKKETDYFACLANFLCCEI